jgi:hypothetical protein
MGANMAYKNLAAPFAVAQVRIFDGTPGGQLCYVTGWSSENNGTAVTAFAVAVEDSGSGGGYLLYGGDWGIRLAPATGDQAWDLNNPAQWGETHLVLADREDLIAAD